MSLPWVLMLHVCAIASWTTGCTGEISQSGSFGGAVPPSAEPTRSGGSSGSSGSPNTNGPSSPIDPEAVPAKPPGPHPLRRLTRVELANTLSDLLGSAVEVPPEISDVLGNSGYQEGANLSKVEAEALLEWTGSLSAAAVAKPMPLTGCTATPSSRGAEDECTRTFISNFGRRAFRRPLTQAERDELFAHYTEKLRGSLALDYKAATRHLVWFMLLSPRFLYHWERPAEPAVARNGAIILSAHEVASRLSYFFWSTMPDETLFAAANAGELATPQQIETQARRLLADARGSRVAESFVLQWLGIGDISRLPKAAKYAFTPALGDAMVAESRRFVRDVFARDGSLETLFTSNTTTLDDPKLAKVYGYSGMTGPTPTSVTLDKAERAGILTSASFLTAQSLNSDLNPIRRGLAVVEHMLCMIVPAPPNNVPPAPSPAATLSTRKRLAAHDENECAAGCHKVFDPAGMAFEHYDGIGAFRTMDGGEPVDSTATIALPSGEEVHVRDAIDLSHVLAKSADVRDCLARKAVRYALRRGDGTADGPSVRRTQQVIGKTTGDLRELLVAVTTTPAFLSRAPSDGETVEVTP